MGRIDYLCIENPQRPDCGNDPKTTKKRYTTMKRPKRYLALLAALVCLTATAAQPQNNRTLRHVTFGVRAGVNFAGMLESVPSGHVLNKFFSGPVTGFHVGGVVDRRLCGIFHLQTGLTFSAKGASYTKEWSYRPDSDKEPIIFTSRDTARPMYLEVPVLASFHFNLPRGFGVQVGAGPYFAVGVGGRYKSTQRYTTENNDIIETSSKSVSSPVFGSHAAKSFHLQRWDIGAVAEAGATWRHLYLGIGYSVGFLNLLKDDTTYAFRNCVGTISIGYNF